MLGRLRDAGIDAAVATRRPGCHAARSPCRRAVGGRPRRLRPARLQRPRALGILADLAPDTPAITVSGAISEETAVATMTAGAVDYVLKDNLTRLAPAVRRAVEGAELRRKQRRAAAQARETMYAIEHSSQAIAYVSRDGTILYSNAAAARLGGVPARRSRRRRPSAARSRSSTRQRWAALWRAADPGTPSSTSRPRCAAPAAQERLDLGDPPPPPARRGGLRHRLRPRRHRAARRRGAGCGERSAVCTPR